MKRKDALYELLIQHAGTYCSGETLAQELGISRAAVWKAVQTLRTECADSIASKKGLLYSSGCRFAHRCCCAATLENAVSGASFVHTYHNQLHKYCL